MSALGISMSQQGLHQNKACKIQTKYIQHKPI